MAATYPATTFQEGVDLTIEASNQLAQVVRGDANTEVTVEDGSTIPSIRKAQVDSMYFKEPEAWTTGQTETDYLQLKKYIDTTTNKESWWFAKSALISNPIAMGTSPFGDDNWTLYTPEDLFISGKAEYESVYQALKGKAAEAGYNLVRGSFEEGGTLTNANDVLWYQADGKYYSWAGAFPKVVAAGATPTSSGGIGAGAWVDRTDVTLRSDINIVVKRFSSVADMKSDTSLTIGQIVETISYHGGWAATGDNPKGGNRYEIVSSTTGIDDGGSFITLASGLQAKGLFVEGEVNVCQFGAKGDGVADDTIATQNALNAGKKILLNYTHKITTTLSVPADTILTGGGVINISGVSDMSTYAAIKVVGEDAGILNITVNVIGGDYRRCVNLREKNTFIKNCTLNVSTQDILTGNPHYIIFAAREFDLDNLIIANNNITASNIKIGDCIQVGRVPNISITNNNIHDITSINSDHHNWGIYVSKLSPFPTIEGNIIHNCSGIGGIHINDDPSIGGNGSNIGAKITNNVIHSVYWFGISVDYSVGAIINGNKVYDTAQGIKLIGGEGNIVTCNNVELTHTTIPVVDSTFPLIQTDSNSKNTIISNNKLGVRGVSTVGIGSFGPNGNVESNVFGDNPPTKAISVGSTGIGTIISGNTIPVAPVSTSGTLEIIGDNSVVEGNIITFGPAPAYGVRLAGGNILVQNNKITGTGNNGIYVSSGTGCIILNNTIYSAATPTSDSGVNTLIKGNIFNSVSSERGGIFTTNGDSTTTVFLIPHGLYSTPKTVVITPNSSASATNFYVTTDSTNITIRYNVAPVVGTNNVKVYWFATI